jgi:hypothetical protein
MEDEQPSETPMKTPDRESDLWMMIMSVASRTASLVSNHRLDPFTAKEYRHHYCVYRSEVEDIRAKLVHMSDGRACMSIRVCFYGWQLRSMYDKWLKIHLSHCKLCDGQ